LSKFFFLNSAFLGLYLVALLFAVSTAEPSGVMATYVNQLSKVRLPLNLSLLLWLGGAVAMKKPISTILVITAIFNWILVIDDYFVVQIQNFTFESTLGQVLASLRPIVAASVSLIAIEARLHERGSGS
tara:strand:- start:2802 stop:3188 length:387 start_codon:yes stop_codon:yes gene_type:complete